MNTADWQKSFDTLGSPRVYYPSLARVMGLVESVLFCQLAYWSREGRTQSKEGWVYKSATSWQEETAITYKQQIRARRSLRNYRVWEEWEDKVNHRLYFRINWAQFAYLMEDALPKNQDENDKTEGAYDQRSDAPKNGSEAYDQRSGGICPKVRSHMTKGHSVLTKSTAETTTENTYPQPFPERKGIFSDSPSRSPDRVFPDPRSPEFPRNGRYPDWHQAVKTFDPVNAALVLSIFPEEGWSQELARKYVKRRQAGQLSPQLIQLASRFYREGRQDETQWMVNSLDGFLSPAKLKACLGPLTEAVKEKLNEIQWELSMFGDLEGARLAVVAVENHLRMPAMTLEEAMVGSSYPASYIAVGFAYPDAILALSRNLEGVKWQLCRDQFILVYCRNNKLDPELIFGFTAEEIRGWQKNYHLKLKTQIKELQHFIS